MDSTDHNPAPTPESDAEAARKELDGLSVVYGKLLKESNGLETECDALKSRLRQIRELCGRVGLGSRSLGAVDVLAHEIVKICDDVTRGFDPK